ncbi:hypothetical protein FGO68_gene15104 [Halteria grandinella]|uniref:TLDc domain-containing protein n=1 Tax=Halteria grandinella TaxID=5974 RepID=A0A8J8SZ93_HALGN|nr:hypothetical protein FGO68_gene15104 [Halteria grandinella]
MFVIIIQMNIALIVTVLIFASFGAASTVPHIGNCSEAFSFAEEQIPGTKFTCANQTTLKVWDCKVIEIMFPICSKEEQCKSFNCQHRTRSDFLESNMRITVDESKWLLEQIKVPNLNRKTVLLFQASRDGWKASDYHKKVDGYTNIYIFYKFKESQRRAAGFTSLDQGISYYDFLNDRQAFILSIDKRIVSTGSKDGRKLFVWPICGPFFIDEDNSAVMIAGYQDTIDKQLALCGFRNYYMPLEDNYSCSLSGLYNGGYHEIDELEVWHIL